MELSALEQIKVFYSEEPKRKNKKRTFCKKCGRTDHVRSTKLKCPLHVNYVPKDTTPKKKGRPFGTKRIYCKLCGPNVTDHVYCTKKKCPKHPEYKASKKRKVSEYHLFIKNYFSKKKMTGKDLDFHNTMKLARMIWKSSKNIDKKSKAIIKI